jgi:hypothetical protein
MYDRNRAINPNNCINYEEIREINTPLYTSLLNYHPSGNITLFGKSKQQYISELNHIHHTKNPRLPRRKY